MKTKRKVTARMTDAKVGKILLNHYRKGGAVKSLIDALRVGL